MALGVMELIILGVVGLICLGVVVAMAMAAMSMTVRGSLKPGEALRCPQCGARVSPIDRHCASCGQALQPQETEKLDPDAR